MALILACRNVFRPSLKFYTPSVYSVERLMPFNTSVQKNQSTETFIEKNQKLKRPLSPHLTIYKPQITSILSLTHRATGIVLSGGLYLFAFGTLAMSAPLPHYMDALQHMHIAAPLIFSLKFILAWSFFYHGVNGVRHLVWDMGYGFNLKTLYMSGYITLGASLLAAVITASIHKLTPHLLQEIVEYPLHLGYLHRSDPPTVGQCSAPSVLISFGGGGAGEAFF